MLQLRHNLVDLLNTESHNIRRWLREGHPAGPISRRSWFGGWHANIHQLCGNIHRRCFWKCQGNGIDLKISISHTEICREKCKITYISYRHPRPCEPKNSLGISENSSSKYIYQPCIASWPCLLSSKSIVNDLLLMLLAGPLTVIPSWLSTRPGKAPFAFD